MAEGLLLNAAADLIDGGGAELDDVEGIEHGDGVLELVVEGVLVAVERIEGRDLDAGAEGLVALVEPVGVDGAGPAGHEVEQPGARSSLAVTGKIDHPGQLLRPTTAVLDRLGADVMPHVLIDPEGGDAAEAGLVIGHLLQQRTRARATRCATSSRAGAPAPGPRRARDGVARSPTSTPACVSNARGRAMVSSCSVNAPAGQSGSTHRQVRLRHLSSTGRPKHGVSISRTSRRPWLRITTPQTRQPSTRAGDSTSTRKTAPRWPSPPARRSRAARGGRREDHTASSSNWQNAQREHAVPSDTVEAFRSNSLVAFDLREASTHLPATQTRESVTPTSGMKSPVSRFRRPGIGRRRLWRRR